MRWLAAALLCSASLCAHAEDGGGRDVTVAVFSTRALRAVTLTPVGAGAWFSRCAACKHEAFTQPLKSSAFAELFAGATVRVHDELSGEDRTAAGLWHMRHADAEVDVVLTLPSERYVASVVSAEADAKEPTESLRAMAILTRTYALNGRHYTARAGHLAAELCDSTQCQAMRWSAPAAPVLAAVRATAGETLWAGTKRAEVFFGGSCGGTTEDAGAVWPTLRSAQYLRGHADPYCVRRDGGAKWHADIPVAELQRIAAAEGWHLPARLAAVSVVKRSASGRALSLDFGGQPLAASALRFGVGRALGFGKIRSDAYTVALRGDMLIFDGRGHGHGVGLCQDGASQMATEGKSAREILAFYFPGTVPGLSAKGEVWSEMQVGAVRARYEGESDLPKLIPPAWVEAQKRLPPRAPVTVTVTLAPSAEMFRQLSGQPGWMLASTRGADVVLQPNGKSALLHELLHALVEAEAGSSTPLWFREGLVEALAGERGGEAMPVAEMEAALRSPVSREASEAAHHAASARVRALLERHGLPVLRQWLVRGVPAG